MAFHDVSGNICPSLPRGGVLFTHLRVAEPTGEPAAGRRGGGCAGVASHRAGRRLARAVLQAARGTPLNTLFSTRTDLQLVRPTVPEILGFHVVPTPL
jgi:hypothetical protein